MWYSDPSGLGGRFDVKKRLHAEKMYAWICNATGGLHFLLPEDAHFVVPWRHMKKTEFQFIFSTQVENILLAHNKLPCLFLLSPHPVNSLSAHVISEWLWRRCERQSPSPVSLTFGIMYLHSHSMHQKGDPGDVQQQEGNECTLTAGILLFLLPV
jgi:hypothetical protein